jgi:hypothetical protein
MISMARTFLLAAVALLAISCREDTTAPGGFEGDYTLVEENGQPLPSDPSAPFGCCLTLSGTLTLTSSTYDLRTSHRNKNNQLEFENREMGTYTRQDRILTFTRTGGAGIGLPYLLAPGELSESGTSVVLLYGDEGPGSNQIRATFQR